MASQSKTPSGGSKGRNRKKPDPVPPLPEREMSVTYSESELESDGDSSPSLVLLSESWRPEYRNKAVPLPMGVKNFRQWGKTVCTLPKYKRSRLCFDELLELGRGNAECQKYLKWIHASYATAQSLEVEDRQGTRQLVSQPRNQATDLALFLKAASYSEELEALEGSKDGGYRREFKA
jgi:hypothetical protein